MGFGRCYRCGEYPFPDPNPPVGSDEELRRRHGIPPTYCRCVPRSLLKEVFCVLVGHRWRGRIRTARGFARTNDVVFAECLRCGRHGGNEGVERRKSGRTRAEDLFIEWEWSVNHTVTGAGVHYRWDWLCRLADWLTGGRCHD